MQRIPFDEMTAILEDWLENFNEPVDTVCVDDEAEVLFKANGWTGHDYRLQSNTNAEIELDVRRQLRKISLAEMNEIWLNFQNDPTTCFSKFFSKTNGAPISIEIVNNVKKEVTALFDEYGWNFKDFCDEEYKLKEGK